MISMKLRLGLLFIMSSLVLSSCGTLSSSRKPPEEWIMLANSGLAGRDNYSYTVNLETGLNQDVSLKTFQFNGQVKSHHEYSINNDSTGARLLHPAQYMDIINDKENSVSFQKEGVDPKATALQVKLLINESSEKATERWRLLLRQQFSQLKLSTLQIEVDGGRRQKIDQLLDSSEQELEQMLSTLQVHSSYKLIVDGYDAVPIAIEEYAVLNYIKDNRSISEYRKCTISLNY